MTKYSLSAASLVAAIPAGYLAYLLVMTFLNKPGFNELAGFFQIIAGLSLTLVTLMVLMPFGILIFGKSPEKVEKPKKEEADDGEDLASDDEEEMGFEDEGEDIGVADEDEEEMFAVDDEEFEDDGFDDFEDDEFK